MKLTKDQRHTAYIITLQQVLSGNFNGVCPAFFDAFEIELDDDFSFSNMKEMLPELWSKRNFGENEYSIFLWRNDYERIEALKKCIEETY